MQNDFAPFDWFRIFVGEQPLPYYGEIAMKIVVVFAVLVVVMRIIGLTGRGDLSPLQQMLVIALGSAAGDVMLYPDVAMGHALLILFGVSLIAVGVEFASTRVRAVRDAIDAHPVVLVLDGKVLRERLHRQHINERELYAVIRGAGGRSLSQVQLAVLEVTGQISVFLDESKAVRDEDLLDYLRDQARTEAVEGPTALLPAAS